MPIMFIMAILFTVLGTASLSAEDEEPNPCAPDINNKPPEACHVWDSEICKWVYSHEFYQDACGNDTCDPAMEGAYPYTNACGDGVCDVEQEGAYPYHTICGTGSCDPEDEGFADYIDEDACGNPLCDEAPEGQGCCNGVTYLYSEQKCCDDGTLAPADDPCGCEEDRQADPCGCGLAECCDDGTILESGQVCCTPLGGGQTTATPEAECCGDVASIQLVDSNGRNSSGTKLEIVSSSSETVQATATSEDKTFTGSCPKWTLNGSNEKQGPEVSYDIQGASPFNVAFLAAVDPKISTISAGGQSVTVSAYHSGSESISIDMSEINKVKSKLNSILGLFLKKTEFVGPVGTVSFTNQWKECSSNNLAYWTFELDAGADPLIGGEFRVPFGPNVVIPAWMQEYVSAGFYVDFSGGLKLVGKLSREECGDITGSVPIGGNISGAIGAQALLFSEDIIGLEVNGSTSVTGIGDIIVNPADGIILKKTTVDWNGLDATVTIEAIWGLVEIDKNWNIVDGQRIYGPTDIQLYQAN